MNILTKLVLVAALLLSVIIPFGYFLLGKKKKSRFKKALGINVFAFFGTLLIAAVIMLYPDRVQAAQAAQNPSAGIGYLAAALATGLSGIGGGIAVASAASAALGAISEDSSIFGKSLIFAGLAEGICLYGLVIAFMILGKL